uniref:lipid-A-disaccharide synthase n=1 Tax=Prasinoderma singulare TaxID=676789 RepID=A0A7S3BP95_9VIRI
MHAAALVRALRAAARAAGVSLEVVACGAQGGALSEAGASIIADTGGTSSIGLAEALPHVVPAYLAQRRARAALLLRPPDAACLIDYPGVNVPFGEWLHKAVSSCRQCYYVPPNEWLLTDRRTPQIVRNTHKLLAVYPGEASHYAEFGAAVTSVGHPLADAVASAPSREEARRAMGAAPGDAIIALVPASRAQELTLVLPPLAEAAARLRARVAASAEPGCTCRVVVPLADARLKSTLRSALSRHGLADAMIVSGRKEALAALAAADVALCKTGSVNLELALLGVPQVAAYRVGTATAFIARRLLKFRPVHVSLANLILEDTAHPEFVQEAADDAAAIADAAWAQLADGEARGATLRAYARLRAMLGGPGAAKRAADEVLLSALEGYRRRIPRDWLDGGTRAAEGAASWAA